MTVFWDQQFAMDGFRYGTEPNAFLQSQHARLPTAARILVPGDGEGRNSVWLAEQGHDVAALDMSMVGLQKAHSLAAERRVPLETIHADLVDWNAPAHAFDVVVLTFVHLPASLRPLVHQKLAHTLRLGGLLLLEAFHPQQYGRRSGGPSQPDMLYSLEHLRADFSPWLHEIFAEETEVLLNEGIGHQGMAWVSRYCGTRTQ